MQVHYLQHVAFEGIGAIGEWASTRGHDLAGTHAALRPLPEVHDFDFLVVLGGPMNIYQEQDHPWLREEKRLIRAAVAARKLVLGVCLGAQLLAYVLG